MRKIRRMLFEIKHRLHFHNPKMLFCSHEYLQSSYHSDKYGSYIGFICYKCGKNMSIQDGCVGGFVSKKD